MAQLQAGQFTHCILNLFDTQADKVKLTNLLHSLSFFELETQSDLSDSITQNEIYQVLCVAHNLLVRGLPTYTSLFVEEALARTLKQTEYTTDSRKNITYPLVNKDFAQQLFEALHVVEPRVKNQKSYKTLVPSWENLIGGFEDDFLFTLVPEYLSDEFVQLFEHQRKYDSVLRYSQVSPSEVKNFKLESLPDFASEAIDFTLENPYFAWQYPNDPHEFPKAVAIEIDGNEHNAVTQRQIDSLRDQIIKLTGWSDTLRIRTSVFEDKRAVMRSLSKFTKNEYFHILSNNFDKPLYATESGLAALQLALSPLGAARIQRVLMEYILSGNLKLDVDFWNIAVVERDVPCAFLAVEDFRLLLKNLFALAGIAIKIPEIKLNIYHTEEFDAASLNSLCKTLTRPLKLFNIHASYDLLIDISILQRSLIHNEPLNTKACHSATIRSAYSVTSKRNVLFAEPINYTLTADNRGSLLYFLNNLFRKEAFLTGQFDVVSKSLQRNNTIALLSPNGGKTVAAIFAALMQPAITLVVEPNSILVKQHSTQLKSFGIDACEAYTANQFQNIPTLFSESTKDDELVVMALPDDFLTLTYRESIALLKEHKKFFATCIIDEVHCLSEWGHDFRPTYLAILPIINKLLSIEKSGIRFIGLSPTANISVLYDIKKEINVTADAIITSLSELGAGINYQVVAQSISNLTFSTSIEMAKTQVATKKQMSIAQYLDTVIQAQRSGNEEAQVVAPTHIPVIVFCPEKYGQFGVHSNEVSGLISKVSISVPRLKIGAFLGTNEFHFDQANIDESRLSVGDSERFLHNEIEVIVAAKDASIGGGKPDIKHVVFFNIPDSLEDFIQKCGKANHDLMGGNVTLLYNNQPIAYKYENQAEIKTLLRYYQPQPQQSETTVDKHILYEQFKRRYLNPKTERASVEELLSEIRFPLKSNLETLERIASLEFGFGINLSLAPDNEPIQLLVTGNRQVFGFLDFIMDSEDIDDNCANKTLALDILQFLKAKIVSQTKSTFDVVAWLQQKTGLSQQPGIEKVLAELRQGEQVPVSIPIANDALLSIAQLLSERISLNYSDKAVENAYKRSYDVNSFIVNLDKIHRMSDLPTNKQIVLAVRQMYFSIRDEFLTFKILHRMSLIGLVSDYVIDKALQTFTVVVAKRNDKDYLIALVNYLSRFVSQGKATEILTNIEQMEGQTVVQKCMNYLIEFAHYEIVPYRFNAINLMDSLVHIISSPSSKLEIQSKVNEYLTYNFSSKYLYRGFETNFWDDTRGYNDFSFAFVELYITQVGYYRENWQHLLNCINELHKNRITNYALSLLRAYVLLLTSSNALKINQLLDEVLDAFLLMKQIENIDAQEYSKRIEIYLNYINEQSTEIKSTIEPVFYLKQHSYWLKSFNNKFLAGYGQYN